MTEPEIDMTEPQPICIGCERYPDQIDEYIAYGAMEEITPDEYVRRYEGTYNGENGHFLCTDCYIKAGQPSNPYPMGNWKAP